MIRQLHAPAVLPPWNRPWYPMYRRLRGGMRSRRYGRKNKYLLEIGPRFLDRSASNPSQCSGWVTPVSHSLQPGFKSRLREWFSSLTFSWFCWIYSDKCWDSIWKTATTTSIQFFSNSLFTQIHSWLCVGWITDGVVKQTITAFTMKNCAFIETRSETCI
jgi:hypothetical protein